MNTNIIIFYRMKKEKDNKKISDKFANVVSSIITEIISLSIVAFVGVFMFLFIVGVDEICSEFLESYRKGDDLASLKLCEAVQEFGELSSVLVAILLPIIFNILFYWICGFWLTIIIQIIIYLTEPKWGKWYGLEDSL